MPLGVLSKHARGAFLWLWACGRATPGPYSARDGAFGWVSGVARPRFARALSEVLLQASFVCKGIP